MAVDRAPHSGLRTEVRTIEDVRASLRTVALDLARLKKAIGSAAGLAASASGDVVGPASATDNGVVRYDGTTGKLIQNSVVTISDTGAMSGVTNWPVVAFTFVASDGFAI